MTDAALTLGDRPHTEFTHRIKAAHGDVADRFHVENYNDEYEGKLLSSRVALYTGPDTRADDVDFVGEMEVQQRDGRAHLWALKVNEEYRRQSIGTFLFGLFASYVREAGADRVSGRIAARGGAAAFLRSRGVPESETEVVTVHNGGDPYEAVAIGAGQAPRGVETAQALEQFDGFPAEEFLNALSEI